MRHKRILLVDDNAGVRKTVREIIEENRAWKICGECGNGQAAIQVARKLRPDILVLDFLMPAMNGLQAAQRIRRFAPDLEIVLFTSDSSPKLVREARECGVKRIIAKTGSGYLQLLSCIQGNSPRGIAKAKTRRKRESTARKVHKAA